MMNNYKPHLDWIAAQLPVMRDELLALSNINSGSYNAEGVNRVADRLRALFAPLGAQRERIKLGPHRVTNDRGELEERPVGTALRLRRRPNAPLCVFLAGHMDTVFGAEHPFQSAKQLDTDTLQGPGVADLKGGLLVMYLALSALEQSPWKQAIGWEALFNPDEEIGSEGSAPLFVEAAQRNHLGLVFEPAFADGNLAGERKGSGNFDLIVRGRAAHAGRDPQLGRNAIRAAADFIATLDDLNGKRKDVTINTGYVYGGGATNIVPDLCIAKFNVRTARKEDEAWLRTELKRVLGPLQKRDGIRLELRGGFTRPPKVVTEDIRRLADYVTDCGKQLDLNLQFKPTGGCCDGNNLAAAGLPNIDNLGVVGGEIHTEREFMKLSSLTERAQLTALLLMRLASGELMWPP